MRLTSEQIQTIRTGVAQMAGQGAQVLLFGSRLHDQARGGDADLLLELDAPVDEPAQLAARLTVRISRAMHGRKVDVVVKAPNLMHMPIHTIAMQEGIRL